MQEIRSAREMRINYEHLKMYEAFYQERPAEHIADAVKDIKKAIRKYRDRPETTVLVKDFGIDGEIWLHELPENVHDKQTALEVFKKNYYLEAPGGIYDCTGKAFTGWYKIFKRRGRWMVYHRICVDV